CSASSDRCTSTPCPRAGRTPGGASTDPSGSGRCGSGPRGRRASPARPWEAPDPGSIVVVVDPGRAFGTGAHATTRLSLELLLGVSPASLVDVGCGSGVIAVAAAKLGFAPVVALDSDR